MISLGRRAFPPDARHQHDGAEHDDDAEPPDNEVYRRHLPPPFLLPYRTSSPWKLVPLKRPPIRLFRISSAASFRFVVGVVWVSAELG